jgi:N-acetylglucosaminyldiphosphoundecaprenol N-acetyl-beta-D-mannosaminyltransferase
MPDGATPKVLLGLRFDPETMGSALARCLEWCAGPRAPHTVVTANAAILCMMRDDAGLRGACVAGDLVLADGMSVVWALRAAGTPVPERVTGCDLTERLLEAGAERGLRVYFLGAREEVVRKLAERCATRHRGLVVAGFRNGYFTEREHEGIVEEIRAVRPDLLFVGMPSPFKEVFCERHRARLDVPVIMGVGGTFDVLAGYVRRAPPRLRRAGLEWAWRLLQEPRKMWKRYLTTNARFLWSGGLEVVARRLGAAPRSPRPIDRPRTDASP